MIITKGHGYTLDELDKDLHTSLGKLGIEGKGTLKIGNNEVKLVYFFHGINEKRWETIKSSGVLQKAEALKKEGIINYVGFSSHYGDTKEILEAADTGIFDVVELPYNIFNRTFGEKNKDGINVLEYVYKKGLGIVNMKAFGGNGLVPIHKILKEYVSVNYHEMLNFCLSNPFIATVDAGAKYIKEFEQDILTSESPRLSQKDMDALVEEADKVSGSMKGICRECMHCMEKFSCVQGIDFPGILALYSRYLICKDLGRDTEAFIRQYEEYELNAQECIECGECVPWCEYKLDIPDMLKNAHEVFSV